MGEVRLLLTLVLELRFSRPVMGGGFGTFGGPLGEDRELPARRREQPGSLGILPVEHMASIYELADRERGMSVLQDDALDLLVDRRELDISSATNGHWPVGGVHLESGCRRVDVTWLDPGSLDHAVGGPIV